MTPDQIDNAIILLQQRYSRADVIPTTLSIGQDDFIKQRAKIEKRRSCAGSIGIITTPSDHVVLARRSDLYVGWSLPGGTVEMGEDFEATFRREVDEEVGVPLGTVDLMIIGPAVLVSPNNEELRFLLTVFAATTPVSELPPPTTLAVEEGLHMQLYNFDSLPNMILQDRAKVDHFYKDWRIRHRWPNGQTHDKGLMP